MTLQETEETLRTLNKRHPGLNEVMLVTLLRAGGWEEKHVEEARLLFRSGGFSHDESPAGNLPPLTEDPYLPPEIDEKHLLVEHIPDQGPVSAPSPSVEQKAAPVERESLVVEKETTPVQEEIPHNLPLRPFETSEHVWPFSRYRDVFFGEEHYVKEVQKEQKEAVQQVESSISEVSLTKQSAPISAPVQESPLPVSPVPVPQTTLPGNSHKGGDDKLVVMACIMLLFILLLLGYMYSNGRL